MNDELISPIEAAKYLHMSQSTLWHRTAPRGPIACVRVTHKRLYRRRDLDAYVEASTCRQAVVEK